MSTTTTSTTTSTPPSLPATHRALVQEIYAHPPTVKTLPTPQLTPGAVILRVLSSKIVSYGREIYNGTRKYTYPTPLTLGTSCVARIAAVPADATLLKVGMLVYYDCTIRSRDNPDEDIFLHAVFDGDTRGSKMLFRDAWRDGCFAEYVRVPLENVYRLDEERLFGGPEKGGLGLTLDDIVPFFTYLVPYGGLRDVGVTAGETVVVAPATGSFGGAAVKVALAMGAGKVIAMGRNEEQLATVVKDGGDRVFGVKITGDWEKERDELLKHGEADVFFDISPPAATESSHFKAGIMAVRKKGRVSLMGGQLQDIKIPIRKIMHGNLTLKGTWMYQRSQIIEMIRMMESGVLKMRKEEDMKVVSKFGLENWSKAFDLAAETGARGVVLLEP